MVTPKAVWHYHCLHGDAKDGLALSLPAVHF